MPLMKRVGEIQKNEWLLFMKAFPKAHVDWRQISISFVEALLVLAFVFLQPANALRLFPVTSEEIFEN